MSSEDDGLPRSPPEMSLLHEVVPSTTIKASAGQCSYLCRMSQSRRHSVLELSTLE